MSTPTDDERLSLGTSFPSMSFRSELRDGVQTKLGESIRKEFDYFYANLEAFLRASGHNANGTRNNVITKSLTVVDNYNTPLPPGVPVPGSVTVVGPDGTASSCCGGAACECEIIPAGSLAFSNFGDTPIEFMSPAGVALDKPDYLPQIPSSCNGLATLANGRMAVVQADTGSPDFLTQLVYTPSLETLIGGEATSSTASIAWNYAGSFYTYRTPAAGNYELLRYDSTGVRTATLDMGFNDFPDINGPIAVAPDQSFGYYCPRPTAPTTIRQMDLAGGVATLITKANYTVNMNAMMCLTDGTLLIGWSSTTGAAGVIELYDNAGVLLRTVLTLAADDAPKVVTPGLSPSSTFWMSYASSAATFSGITLAEVDISTGDILNQFDPEVGTVDFGSPFCVLRQGIRAMAA